MFSHRSFELGFALASRLPKVPDNLNLESSNGMLFSILAEFDKKWGELCFTARKEHLTHLLNEGHTKIELNDACGPIVGTGGTGQYIAMPIRPVKTQAAPEAKTTETAPESQEIQTFTPTNTTTKESTIMETKITPAVSASVYGFTSQILTNSEKRGVLETKKRTARFIVTSYGSVTSKWSG